MARPLPMADMTRGGEPPVFARIAVFGCGLVGGSLALAARTRWPGGLVIAIDRKPVIEAAIRLGAIDVGGDDPGLAGEADLIVLAAPVRGNLEILSRLGSLVAGGAIVTDVGGTKREVVDAAARLLPSRLAFVGGHPLAGAARGGVEQARHDLFEGRPWILTPDASSPDAHVDKLEAFVAGVGGLPRRMAAAEHDRVVAYLSHLPQLTASALMNVVGRHAGVEGLKLAGRGLRDTTRLAASPADIWQDVVATNGDHVRAALDELIGVLGRLRDGGTDGAALGEVFEAAGRWKAILDDDANG
jgi:prephenate dehydrogenase